MVISRIVRLDAHRQGRRIGSSDPDWTSSDLIIAPPGHLDGDDARDGVQGQAPAGRCRPGRGPGRESSARRGSARWPPGSAGRC